ncbi:MAG: LysR family transcriptional regulator [Vulcanimicrobiota bacterium]
MNRSVLIKHINFHHLFYFWRVARVGTLTRVAEEIHISQSALSTQIRMLEEELGQSLFIREKRSLVLTEAGRIALDYADQIFARGEELLATLSKQKPESVQTLRVGAVATLSRNFQESFLRPLMGQTNVRLVAQSAGLQELLLRLGSHELDLVLSNRRVRPDERNPWICHRIARQRVSLVGPARPDFRFPQDLQDLPVILPGQASEIRASFDNLCLERRIQPRCLAEVDDMAMLRVLLLSSRVAGVVPPVVVRDELRQGVLQEYCRLPEVYEEFFATSVKRQYQSPLLKLVLNRKSEQFLS